MTTQGSGSLATSGGRPPAPSFGGRPGGGRGGGRSGGRSGGRAGGRSGGRRGGRPRYYARRKLCAFCVDHIDYIDYKETDRFRRFVTDRYKIESRRKTGVCTKHQRGLSAAIKRARHLALMPFSPDHTEIGSRYGR